MRNLLTEMNSAVGTLNDGRKEAFLESLIEQYSQYPEALGNYQEWLAFHGMATSSMRTIGASEATMHVFAQRLKNGRSWSDKGIAAFIRFMIALKDDLAIKTLVGTMNKRLDITVETNPPKYYKERFKN